MFTRQRLTAWTKALRENPEQQTIGMLCNLELTKFCCLGKLCEVEGLTFTPVEGTGMAKLPCGNMALLPISIVEEFGSNTGHFGDLGMPNIKKSVYNPKTEKLEQLGFTSAAEANDNGCTWAEIADHFDTYYPCSDEPPKRDGPSIQIDIYDRAVS